MRHNSILQPQSQPSNNSSELDSYSIHHSLHCRQAAGACWYLLGIQRATECLKRQCVATDGCRNRTVACVDPMYYGTTRAAMDGERLAWAKNLHVRSLCLDSSDNFEYGSYKWIVNLVTNPSRLEKVLFPIFWGLMTLRQAVLIFLYHNIANYLYHLCMIRSSAEFMEMKSSLNQVNKDDLMRAFQHPC